MAWHSSFQITEMTTQKRRHKSFGVFPQEGHGMMDFMNLRKTDSDCNFLKNIPLF